MFFRRPDPVMLPSTLPASMCLWDNSTEFAAGGGKLQRFVSCPLTHTVKGVVFFDI